ncbi:MAG: hypothetical protein WAZ19_02865 [Anaerolineae bacterium]
MFDLQAVSGSYRSGMASFFSLIGTPSSVAVSNKLTINTASAEQQTFWFIVLLAFLALATILILHHHISTR